MRALCGVQLRDRMRVGHLMLMGMDIVFVGMVMCCGGWMTIS